MRASIRDLAFAALGARATDRLIDALYRRSEGLPLVVEEDLRTLLESPSAPTWHDSADPLRKSEVPHGLREAVTERITRLSPDGGRGRRGRCGARRALQ